MYLYLSFNKQKIFLKSKYLILFKLYKLMYVLKKGGRASGVYKARFIAWLSFDGTYVYI